MPSSSISGGTKLCIELRRKTCWMSQRDLTSSPLQKRFVSLAYFVMRLGIFCVIGLLFGADAASSQTGKNASPTLTPALLELRPALIGTAPTSLINTIDTADLIKK